MRFLSTLPQDDLAEVPPAARAAEAAGYDGLVTSENKNDPFLALGVAAVSTSRLALHTGIAIAFSRSPMPVANASWDLQVASRGRFVLGLGSQVRAHNENRFSVPWSAPAPAYWPVLDVHGLQELGRKLNVMSKAGPWDKMAAEISDDVVRRFAAVGTHRQLAGAIAERFGGVTDSVTLSGGYGVRQAIPPDLVQDIRRIPSAFVGFDTRW